MLPRLWILSTVLVIAISEDFTPILSRKKRYLVFPEGSSVTYTLALSQNLLNPLIDAWAAVVESDISYKLPFSANHLWKTKKKKKKPHYHYYYQHRRDRRELYQQLEEVLDMKGLNGTACVKRAVCETANGSISEQSSFVHDMMRLIFRIPPGNDDEVLPYEKAAAMLDCEPWIYECPISLLDFHLSHLWE